MERVSHGGLRVAVLARSVYPLHRYGGLERHVYDLVRYLVIRGAHVTLITPPGRSGRPSDANAESALASAQVEVRSVPYTTFPFAGRKGTTILDRSTAYPLFGWRAGRVAANLARVGAIDVVHGLGASVFGYRGPAPMVFNPQGLEEFGATDPSRARLKRLGYWPLRQAVKRCARAADRVIATDRALVEPVVNHLGVPRTSVRVVPNAIDTEECDTPAAKALAAELRKRVGVGPDDVLLLSVGRLESNKGFGVLMSALQRLSSGSAFSTRPWRWVLVGDGPLRGELTRAIASSGLASHVKMTGRVGNEELHGWYEAATCFVHPTLYEGSSLVTLEAMAHRRAVIASRAGGLPDKVIPGTNGWLVEPGDEGQLAEAVREAISDSQRLGVMGAASRALVDKEFSWSAAVDRLLDVYAELLPARRVRYSHPA